MDEPIITRNRRSLSTSGCRRAGVAAVVLAASFACGFSPLATAPVAHADVEDSLGDLIFSNVVAALDAGGQGGAGASSGLETVAEQLSVSVHDQIEAAITDPVNAPLLDAINFPSVALFGRDLIGNGIEVGDPIPALNFLDQSSGPLADTFTGTNEGLLTPELTALHIDVGSLHDGGFLLGDNAAGGTATPADPLPPISCVGDTTDPLAALDLVTATSFVVCDGPADIGVYSQLYYDYIIPVGSPGAGLGVGTAETNVDSVCVPGIWDVAVAAGVIFPPGYTPLTPEFQEYTTTPIVITSCT